VPKKEKGEKDQTIKSSLLSSISILALLQVLLGVHHFNILVMLIFRAHTGLSSLQRCDCSPGSIEFTCDSPVLIALLLEQTVRLLISGIEVSYGNDLVGIGCGGGRSLWGWLLRLGWCGLVWGWLL
jgi:hypothetical protein